MGVKALQGLGEMAASGHAERDINKEGENTRVRDIQGQPREMISSPGWSGWESEHVSDNAGITTV